jgi:hypothetical protein
MRILPVHRGHLAPERGRRTVPSKMDVRGTAGGSPDAVRANSVPQLGFLRRATHV